MYACVFAHSGKLSQLAELANRFSPLVETVDDRTVVFSIAGLHRLFGDSHQIAAVISQNGSRLGIQASLAMAANPATAILAARNLRGVTIVAPGDEARALSPIAIDALPAAPDTLAILRRWGISTLGQLAGLPEIGLVERLGQAGSHLRRLALGQAVRILDPDAASAEYSAHQTLDDPVELLEPLLFVVSAQLDELAKKLTRDGRAAARIVVALDLEKGGEFQRTIDLPYPTHDAKALLKQVQLSLEANPPKAATMAVRVVLEPADPRIHQSALFLAAAPEPEKLETLVARLRALVGPSRVGSPELLDTHRPDAYRLRPCAFEPVENAPATSTDRPLRLAFRYFRPPIAARVALDKGQPRRIASSEASGAIVEAAGPWRSSGEWWNETRWDRDEWDIVLDNRGAYRLYVASQRWFLDGSYD